MEMERRGSIRRSCVLTQLRKQEDVLTKTKPFIIDKRRVLQAYRLVKANRGAAGVDRESIKDFEEDLKNNLYKIWNRLSSGSYIPPPVKAVSIPKKSGGKRIIEAPHENLKNAQRESLRRMQQIYLNMAAASEALSQYDEDVREMLADNATGWRKMKRSLARQARPSAAHTAANFILNQIESQ